VQIGLALRIGCVLAGAAPGVLPEVGVSHPPGGITLNLPPGRAELAGEEVEKRLGHLAGALGVEPHLEIGGR
jgi:exopolyphosphatase / guanosine-5'-triphosphate,3'-diphosphate pyrophosphatase